MKLPPRPFFRARKNRPVLPLAATVLLLQGMAPLAAQAQTPAPMNLATAPLATAAGAPPNVLMIMDNSNSMDEAPDGSTACPATTNDVTTAVPATPCGDATAVTVGGSGSPLSKSEIARRAAKSIIDANGTNMNIGLMAYQQQDVTPYFVYNSFYDASFDPANYAPDWDLTVVGARATGVAPDARNFPGASSTTVPHPKKYRYTNPSAAGKYIYYNVALPFYMNAAQGAAFCRSTDANTAANQFPAGHPDGFWSTAAGGTYTCYSAKTDTSDTTNGSGTTYTSSFVPTDSDYAAAINIFGRWTPSTASMGKTWFSEDISTSSANGYLHVPIARAPGGSTQYNNLITKLNPSQFVTNAPTNISYPLQNAGNTPMAGTIKTANDYFNNSLTNAAQGSGNAGYSNANNYSLARLASCSKNFAVYLTDGMPSTAANGTSVTNPATALTEVVNATTALRTSTAKVETYVIGFGAAVNVDQLNAIANAGDPKGSRGAYSASDPASLDAAMGQIFQNIISESSAAAAVAANSTQLQTDSAVYQAKYNTADWSGQLLAYPIITTINPMTGDITYTFGGSATWDASTKIPACPAISSGSCDRHIYTSTLISKQGIPFKWTNFDTPDQAKLITQNNDPFLPGPQITDYIAGSHSNEGVGANNYRVRSSLLGDIANSAPVYVGKPVMGYPDSLAPAPYSQFVTDKKDRAKIVYVGANDGMLHAFSADTGAEQFAYVPSMLFAKLPALAAVNYPHQFYVDGSPTVSDAYFGGQWRTVLVGGLGAGGQGIYALDVTDPSVFASASGASSVLWEFTDRQTGRGATATATWDIDLGYTFSQPSIARIGDSSPAGGGRWVAIFGNGYNNMDGDGSASATGNAVLYVVDLTNGQLIQKFDTGYGWRQAADYKPNGLSTPAVADVNGDGNAEYVYAGDLQGHMWKFDLASGSVTLLFTATDSSGKAQPITAKPEVGAGPATYGGQMVYFGTGKSIEQGDNTLATPQNTFYAIWDDNQSGVSNRSALVAQTISTQNAFGAAWRMTSANPVNYGPVRRGWYMDLPETYEKSISNPQLNSGRIIFVTNTPSVSSDSCSVGGTSWLMEVSPLTGSPLQDSPFDSNGDGNFTDADKINNPGPRGPQEPPTVPPSGMQQTGITTQPTILFGADKQVKLQNSSAGSLTSTPERLGTDSKRQSWRDLSVSQ